MPIKFITTSMFIIPMAGMSSRFFKAGYKKPKYMLPLGDSLVFDEAVKSFDAYFQTDLFLFIVRDENGVVDFVNERCDKLKIKDFEVITLDTGTRGQAETVYKGLISCNRVNKEDEVFIYNIDSIRLDFKKPNKDFLNNIRGYLEVFKGDGEHWSFVEPLNENLVKKTTEKIPVSNLCSNGLYYFDAVYTFLEAYSLMEENNEYKELFIAPMYNYIIYKKDCVKYLVIDKSKTLFSGVPSEYEELKLMFGNFY